MILFGLLIVLVIVLGRKAKNQTHFQALQARFAHIVPRSIAPLLKERDYNLLIQGQSIRAPIFCSSQQFAEFPHKIYLSLTSSPDRIKFVPFVLNQLDLSRVHEIHVNLPRKFGRNKKEYKHLPDELVHNPKVRIFWHEKDLGPVMKMLPTIERLQTQEPNAIVISMDDDQCLPVNLVDSLASGSIACDGNAVFAGTGNFINTYMPTKLKNPNVAKVYQWSQECSTDKMTYVNWPQTRALSLVEGFFCVAYRPRLIHVEQLKQISSSCPKCFTSDDMAISLHLASKGVGARALDMPTIGSYSFGTQADALHVMQDHHASYEQCIDGAIQLAEQHRKQK